MATTATKPRMKPEVKKAWVEALLSGEYPQATGKLYTAGPAEGYEKDYEGNTHEGFCCLGVLCDLATKATKRHIPRKAWVDDSMPPFEVLKWAGFDVDPETYGADPDEVFITNARRMGAKVPLTSLNDGNWMATPFKRSSFKEIAKIIERDF